MYKVHNGSLRQLAGLDVQRIGQGHLEIFLPGNQTNSLKSRLSTSVRCQITLDICTVNSKNTD
jgi:hypothetical protein